MPASRWRNPRSTITLLLVAASTLFSVPVGSGLAHDALARGPHSALEAPLFEATLNRGQLTLTGTTVSAEHEYRLLQLVASHFVADAAEIRFNSGILVADSWAPATARLLHAMAALESASAVMHEQQITLRGTASDTGTVAERLRLVRDVLPSGAVFENDIIVVEGSATLEDLCQRTFAELVTEPIAFRQSSAEVRTSSYTSLDRIVDFAYDCRDASITIIGHSDASGDRTWNRRLSQARAQAVADYLVRGGVAADRLHVEGRGASMPIADNDTPQGRSLNRRIEFELRQPLL